MPRPPLAAALGRLRPPDDAALLARHLGGDPAAFAALVRRHGPMVLGVCRRVLPVEADAEDAFQATFLLLARKAAGVRQPARVGNWLYGVARNVARRARAAEARRRRWERAAAVPVARFDRPAESVVDDELHRLPDRYRLPIVCCGLDGMTMKEAAVALGWPAGTVATRLNRGRALLADRLARRGVVVPAVLAAAVSEPLIARTVAAGPAPAAVLSLVTEATRAMLFAKLKALTAVLAAVAVGAGLVFAQPPKPAAEKPTAPAAEPTPARKLIERLKAEKPERYFDTDKWAATLAALIRLGPAAVPDVAAELDATDDNFLLRCLGFAARGIGDERAVPALIRALPKTCTAANGGYGLRCKDPTVLAVLQKHATGTNAGDTFGFGSPLNEVAAALQKLTGSRHGEDELSGIHLAGTVRQQAAQRALFQRSAERWAAWWEAGGRGPVGLAPSARPAVDLAGLPRGGRVEEALRVMGGTLEPAGGGGPEVFFDLDTGRQAGLPARLRPDQADEIAAWAAAEGFDLMGVEATAGGKPCYAVRGLGLTAWPLDPARRADVLADLKGDKPLAVGLPAGGLLAPFDAAAGRHRAADPALFLFRTREGGHGWLFVGTEVRTLLAPSDKPRAVAADPASDPVGVRKGRRFDYALVVEGSGQ